MTEVRWRTHLSADPEGVWDFLATSEGRARFWAESAEERDGAIEFVFPSGERHVGRVVESSRPDRYAVDYFGTPARFELARDESGGTELTLVHDVPEEWHAEVNAGWVSMLMALKAAVDHDVDLRNHDASRTWSEGYCDN